MAKSFAYDPRYALNAICPYYTMFPLEYPIRALNKHKDDTPIVFDPFCGRGTTIYAARYFGLEAWGMDTSPIAVAVAKAKLASAEQTEIIALAKKYIEHGAKKIPSAPFFKSAFHTSTLRDICAIREGLMRVKKESNVNTLLRAAMLGCLHGPLGKNNHSYFSNQMPRTFATKPDYSVQYWKARDLKAPKINVVTVLTRKLSRITDLSDEIDGTPAQIVCANSCLAGSYRALPKKISTVVTSPPYYGMTTYIQDQWLRMWFLGGPENVDYSTESQIKHSGEDVFIKELASVWKNIHKSKSDDLHMYIRFGSLPSTKKDARYILKTSLEEATGWHVVSVRNASDARAGKRQADHMSAESTAPVDEYDFHVIRS